MTGLSLINLLVQLPLLVVLSAGILLLAARRRHLPRRTVSLGTAGCGVLLLAALVTAGWAAVQPGLFPEADPSSNVWGVLTLVVGFIQVVLYSGGIGLLLAALLARGGPARDELGRAARGAAAEPGGAAAGGPPGWNAPPAAVWNGPPAGGWNAPPATSGQVNPGGGGESGEADR